MNIFKRIYTEIDNYIFLKNTIKVQEKTHEWAVFKLRRDWIYRIYTVISLEEDFIQQVGVIESVTAVLDEAEPIFKYFTRLNLQEIIAPDITKIPGTNSWLVVMSPLFRVLTIRNVAWTIGLITASILGYFFRSDLVTLYKEIKSIL